MCHEPRTRIKRQGEEYGRPELLHGQLVMPAIKLKQKHGAVLGSAVVQHQHFLALAQ